MADTTQEFRGKVGGMSEDEMETFLDRGVCARVACIDLEGNPYVTVVWHEWRDGAFWFVGRQRAAWCEYMKSDARVSIVVDVPDTLEKVFCSATAEVVEEPNVGGDWVGVAERMAVRYLRPDGPTYLTPTLKQPRWLIKATPVDLQTWQGVGWARRYWVNETGGPSYDEAHGFEQ